MDISITCIKCAKYSDPCLGQTDEHDYFPCYVKIKKCSNCNKEISVFDVSGFCSLKCYKTFTKYPYN